MSRVLKLVVVDVGNTSTAVGLWSGGRVSRVGHFDADEGAARAHAAALCARGGVAGCAYLSVVPARNAGWRAFVRSELALPFVQIAARTYLAAGGRLDYPHPETIGADRLADAAAAVETYGAPVIVCDFGTAFTAAVVTADGVWRGGAIAPGLPLMLDYLHERTAQLPRIAPGGRCPKIGRSTEEAMRLGTLAGCRGMVRGIVERLAAGFGGGFRLVATGGFARWALKDSDLDAAIDPTLTLRGAGLLAARTAFADGKEGAE